jgi:DNA repair exonuclease SbcCD ATPase subunit
LNATVNDPTSPFFSEVARLRQELERANQSIDEKLEQIEEAGIDVINLARQVEDGRVRIASLEDDVTRLTRKDDRRTRRLQKMRCGKCRTKVDVRNIDADERCVSTVKKLFDVPSSEGSRSLPDLSTSSLPSNPPTPPTRTSEALKADLRAVNQQLEEMKEQWERERKQLLGEKAILQDTTHKLNLQVRSAQDEAKRSAEGGKAAQRAKVSAQAVSLILTGEASSHI